MKGSKKLGFCLIFLHVILCLAGASLCGVCIFIAVTTYDFQSLITEEIWNNVIGLGSLGAFAVLTGLLGCLSATCYEKKITILLDVFLFVAIIGMVGTGIFFHLESSEISESDFNRTLLERPDIGSEVSNKLDCSLSIGHSDYCAGVFYDYFSTFRYVLIGLIGLLLLLQEPTD
ncbi:uncharacterized protein [Dysidea avara]|uniref:uncharacterized protein isoform X2 n=1 Tax=Dysidea avara TaxID=196820 RepID=UPI0033197973